MGSSTSIAWTDSTVNPLLARRLSDGKLGYHCVKVSAECALCYAERFNLREMPERGTGLPFQARSTKEVEIILDPASLAKFAKWGPKQVEVDGQKTKRPRRVFWVSMSDLFGEFVPSRIIQLCLDAAVSAGERVGTISQILTKRPDRLFAEVALWTRRRQRRLPACIWPGFSAGNRALFFERWPVARELRAQDLVEGHLWCSYEPAIGPLVHSFVGVDVEAHNEAERALWRTVSEQGLDWAVVGGESGGGARNFELRWARDVVAFLGPAGVAVFYKQGGRSNPCPHSAKGEHFECFPADLQVREFPF